MENLPTFVLHSTKQRSIWRFLLPGVWAAAATESLFSSCEQELQVSSGHICHHTLVLLAAKGSFNILVSCSLSSSGCSSSCGQARPSAGAWSHLRSSSGDKGVLMTPENVPGPKELLMADGPCAPGALHVPWRAAPSRTEMEGTAVEGQHCRVWTAGSIHGPLLSPSFPIPVNLFLFSHFLSLSLLLSFFWFCF